MMMVGMAIMALLLSSVALHFANSEYSSIAVMMFLVAICSIFVYGDVCINYDLKLRRMK